MSKRLVLLDVDGVLADFSTAALKWVNYTLSYAAKDPPQRALTVDDIHNHDILKSVGLERRQESFDRWCQHSEICRHMPVYDGAQEFVEKLRSFADIVIVTASYGAIPGWESQRRAWLLEHFGIHKNDVIFAKRKDLVRGGFFVDDRTENVVAWKKVWPGPGVLFSRPWNALADYPLRAKSYDEVLEIVRDG